MQQLRAVASDHEDPSEGAPTEEVWDDELETDDRLNW